MKPPTARYLDKANKLLKEAETMVGIGLSAAAGRSAYLAGFHAAQALIFERQGRAMKTHSGVQTEFHRLIKNDVRFDENIRTFLSRAYNLKAVADYETGPGFRNFARTRRRRHQILPEFSCAHWTPC
jgi:uncharacterized protein (UPF0332 family)